MAFGRSVDSEGSVNCNLWGLLADVKACGWEPDAERLRGWGLMYEDEGISSALWTFFKFVMLVVGVCFCLIGAKVGIEILWALVSAVKHVMDAEGLMDRWNARVRELSRHYKAR